MIDQVDSGLKDWAGRVLGDAQIEDVVVSFNPPSPELQEGRGVSIYLVELVDTPPPRIKGRTPLQFSVKYMLSTWADEPGEAHRLLGELAFAAMENPEFQVEFAPLNTEIWKILNVVPAPSFMLRVPVKKMRAEPEVSVVTRPISVETVPTTRLEGMVLSPDDIPLMDVRLEFRHLRMFTRTDLHGRFVFPNVPLEPRTKELLLAAKGYEVEVSVELPPSIKDILEIRFNPLD